MTENLLISDFAHHGYTIVRGALRKEDCAKLVTKLTAAFDSEPWLDSRSPQATSEDKTLLVQRRLKRLDEIAPERRRLMLSETIRTQLRALMDDEPVLVTQNIPFRFCPSHPSYAGISRSPERNAHVHHYSHIEPRSGCVLAWLALEDVAKEAGPMWFSPGSHKNNQTLFDDILADYPALEVGLVQLRNQGAAYSDWVDWFSRMQAIMTDRIENSILPEHRLPILLKQGDLVLFDPALSHGTLPPADAQRSRWSIVAKYKGRDATEWAWSSWFGSSIYEAALQHVPPADFEIALEAGGYYAVDPLRDHLRMFWPKALPPLS